MYVSNRLKKTYIVISILLLTCMIAGTGIYAMEAFNDGNAKQVDIHTPVTIDITNDLKIEPKERRKLNESPVYIAETSFHVVTDEKMKSYTLKKQVRVYRDQACNEEISSGIDVEIRDSTEQIEGEHIILLKLSVQDSALAGQNVYVKFMVSIEKY